MSNPLHELDDVIADVVRPAGDQAIQPPPVACEQRARGFLEVCKVARHRRHEMIGGVPRRAAAIPVATAAAGLVDQLVIL